MGEIVTGVLYETDSDNRDKWELIPNFSSIGISSYWLNLLIPMAEK